MTIIGFRDIVDGFTSRTRDRVSSEGGLWLMAIDGLLLVPLVFAAFFYPIAAAVIGVGLAVVTIGVVVLARTLRG